MLTLHGKSCLLACSAAIVGSVLFLGAAPTPTPQSPEDQVTLPTGGVCILEPSEGSPVKGIILLRQENSGVHLTGEVTGLKPGLHGFHIHEFGDLRDPQGKSAGGHFNPDGSRHGGPNDKEHHAGDLGNIEASSDGVAQLDIEAPWLKLHFIVGRSLVVHEGKDDLTSQPSGDAGARAAIGIIGIAQSDEANKSSKR